MLLNSSHCRLCNIRGFTPFLHLLGSAKIVYVVEEFDEFSDWVESEYLVKVEWLRGLHMNIHL